MDLTSLLGENPQGARLLGKLESLGPCSSVKDRLGRSMIDQAEKDGAIKSGETVLVEPTSGKLYRSAIFTRLIFMLLIVLLTLLKTFVSSGNTGIALAFIARERGYRLILTMPETMSVERRMMLLALGAEVVLTPKEKAVSGAIAKAHEIVDELDGKGFMLQQFENPSNPKIHRETTGPEIWADTDGEIDIFVSGVGTGGTVTGVSQYIKGCSEFGLEPKKAITTIAVEPQEQMLLTEAKGGEKIGEQGPHKIQGMGAGIVPPVIDLDMIDEVIAVHSDAAAEMTNKLWMMGLPTGISAGAIVAGAARYCQRPEAAGKLAVAIIPSFGERYFTHPMFADIKEKAESLAKQPLPPPFDNTEL